MWLYILLGFAIFYVSVSLFSFYRLREEHKKIPNNEQEPYILSLLGFSFGFVWLLIPLFIYDSIRRYFMMRKFKKGLKRLQMEKEHEQSIKIPEKKHMKRYIYHSPFGGNHKPRATVVGLLNEQTRRLDIGISRCSERDMFSRKTGRDLAFERARKPEDKRETVTFDVNNKEEIDNIFYKTAKALSEVVLEDPRRI